jgi:hypothetical protein
MGCNCGKPKTNVQRSYLYTAPDGKRTVYKSEVEAAAAVSRSGGTYRAQ